MEVVRRLVSYWPLRIVAGAVLMIVLLHAAFSEPVIDPLINFFFAGVVPGTSIILSPDEIFRDLLYVGAALAVLLLAVVVRHVFKRRSLHVTDDKTVHVKPVPVTAPAAKVARPRRQITVPTAQLAGAANKVRVQVKAIINWTKHELGLAFRSILIFSAWAVATMIVITELVSRWSAVHARRFWRFAKPHLKRFDGYLELQYRAVERKLAKRAARSDRAQVLAAIYRDTRRRIYNYFN